MKWLNVRDELTKPFYVGVWTNLQGHIISQLKDECGNLIFDIVETKRICAQYYAQPYKVGGTLMTKTQVSEQLSSKINSMLTCSTQECFALEKEISLDVLTQLLETMVGDKAPCLYCTLTSGNL